MSGGLNASSRTSSRKSAGVRQPPARADADDPQEVTFHEFASRWWAARKAEALRPKTQEDYEWQLRKHLLPFFHKYAVADIDIALVERYREEKLIEREHVKAAAASGTRSAIGAVRHGSR